MTNITKYAIIGDKLCLTRFSDSYYPYNRDGFLMNMIIYKSVIGAKYYDTCNSCATTRDVSIVHGYNALEPMLQRYICDVCIEELNKYDSQVTSSGCVRYFRENSPISCIVQYSGDTVRNVMFIHNISAISWEYPRLIMLNNAGIGSMWCWICGDYTGIRDEFNWTCNECFANSRKLYVDLVGAKFALIRAFTELPGDIKWLLITIILSIDSKIDHIT